MIKNSKKIFIAIFILLMLVGISWRLAINEAKNYSLLHSYVKDQVIPELEAKELIELLEKFEFYQPLYNVKLPKIYNFFNPIKRDQSSKARAEAVFNYLSQDIKVKRLRILDVGSNLGYMSLYFGDHGNIVHGIDIDPDQVKISNLLAKLSNLPNVRFNTTELNPEYINNIDYYYDVAFIFSVLHHVITSHGLEYTQDLMIQLLDRIPLLIVEFALPEENVRFKWKNILPDNPLAVFDKCVDCEFEKLGYFDTHLSEVKRPIYVVRKKSLNINDKSYSYDKLKLVSYDHSDDKLRDTRLRRYYHGKDFFLKEIIINNNNTQESMDNIIAFYSNNMDLISSLPIPKLIDWEKKDNRFRLVFETVGKAITREELKSLTKKQKINILYQTVKIASTLANNKIYHNDIRLWNLIIKANDSKNPQVFLIDFDSTSSTEEESLLESILWLMLDINKGDIELVDHTKKNIWLTPADEYGIFSKIATSIINKKVNNIHQLLEFIENNDS